MKVRTPSYPYHKGRKLNPIFQIFFWHEACRASGHVRLPSARRRPPRMDGRSRRGHHAPHAQSGVGRGVAAAGSAAARSRLAALRAGRLACRSARGRARAAAGRFRRPVGCVVRNGRPPADGSRCGRAGADTLRAGRAAPAAHRPQLRHGCAAAQPRRTAPQRKQRLLVAHRLASARLPVDPHGVLHLPRRPHRTHDRRDPHAQGPCRRRGARDLRCVRIARPEPESPRPAPPGRRRGASLRSHPLPVVHSAGRPAQPPENSRYGWEDGLSGWHQYCEILPRRKLHGPMARRASADRRRRRGRSATALHRRLGAFGRPHSRPFGPVRTAPDRWAAPDPDRMVRGRSRTAHARRSLRRGHRPRQAYGQALVALLHAAARRPRCDPHRRAQRRARGGDDPRVQRLAADGSRVGVVCGRSARCRRRTLPLRQRVSARQGARRGRRHRLGRHGQHGLPQPAGQPRGYGLPLRACASSPRRSTATSGGACGSAAPTGGTAPCGGARWATCCGSRPLSCETPPQPFDIRYAP